MNPHSFIQWFIVFRLHFITKISTPIALWQYKDVGWLIFPDAGVTHNGCTNADIGPETYETSMSVPIFVFTKKMFSTSDQINGFSEHWVIASGVPLILTKSSIFEG